MSKTIALSNFLVGIFPQQKTLKLQSLKKTHSGLSFYFGSALLLVNIVFLGSYIYGVNNYASKGYETKVLLNKVAQLNSNIKNLNLEIATATSMAGIQSDFTAYNFVPAGTPKFLQAPGQFTLR